MPPRTLDVQIIPDVTENESALERHWSPPSRGRMISLSELADILDVSISTIRRRVAEGGLRVHRIGRAVRVSEIDLAVFLEASRGEDA